ncbi:putative AAA-ATPase [Halanaerobium saccharolyticum]|uniref:Putative AAA-ATPase n=1 Tax=Halanaerobium saccharolyticum TaxID=43595 RepID=A0A4V3CEV4_9FIRM|nr:AAA family ATPase [Halanaerobium saccharolyticum]TDO91343.1 putative AAA-ATPase [Halanaerobium saccharolyticum]
MKKKLPVGIDDFKNIREENYYYVDKSLFIKEIIDDGAQVILLPRPRRFGKTLNLSMLKYYFENNEEDYSYLFKNLKIKQTAEEYLAKQGKFPVINLTFKDIKENSWPQAEIKLKRMVAREFKRHKYLLESDVLDQYDKEFFQKILSLKAENAFYEESLKDLSDYLAAYHQEKVIILIDEYDQPIQAAYYNNYYDKMINFMRNFLSAGLKNNLALEKGILTGILRVAKESIFSGLNNPVVSTLLDNEYSKYFGLLENEIKELFNYYALDFQFEDLKNWYNGYYFGENIIYNPWSIINCLRREGEIEPYWANTSSNDIIKDLIINSESEVKKDLEILLKGDTINKKIDENIIFSEIDKKVNIIWSFLLLSGYLTFVEKERREMYLYCDLKIPNKEIRYIFENIITQWFEENLSSQKLNILLKSLSCFCAWAFT